MINKKTLFAPVVVGALAFTLTLGCGGGADQQDMSDEQAEMSEMEQPSNGGYAYDDSKTGAKVTVDNLNVTTEPNAVVVEVQGSLPSPDYTFERFEVDVDDNVIRITPYASQSSDNDSLTTMAPQDSMGSMAMVDFQESYRVENLSPGTYELIVFGELDSLTQQVTIGKSTAAKPE